MTFQLPLDRHDEGLASGGGRESHHRIIRSLPDVLDVVAVVSNPVRFRSRNDLARAFFRHVEESGARLTVVECAFGNRPFEVTSRLEPGHVQLRTAHELWNKESLVNAGIARLPRDWRYVAWCDADVTFQRPDWVQETLQQLQHYPIVQMFSEAHDLDPDGMVMSSFRSFGWSHVHGVPRKRHVPPSQAGGLLPALAPAVAPQEPGGLPVAGSVAVSATAPGGPTATATTTTTLSFGDYYGPGMEGAGDNPRIAYWHHPGFAWAARREAVDTLGGLFDVAVVGESDYMMAKSLVGEVEDMIYPGVSPAYRKAALDWQTRAVGLRKNLGFVQGMLIHGWHGRKVLRNYWDRCRVLVETKFDPTTDLKRDWQGLYQLADDGTPRSIMLRDSIRAYFRSRREDGTEL